MKYIIEKIIKLKFMIILKYDILNNQDKRSKYG